MCDPSVKKESRRRQRVADVVRAELSRLLLLEAHDPDLHRVTVTDVEMPPDLKSARVFFSCLGGDDEREQGRPRPCAAPPGTSAARSGSGASCVTRRSSTSSPIARSSAAPASRSCSSRCGPPSDEPGEGGES